MTQTKSKKIKYASKVEEQIVEAIKTGKSLSGVSSQKVRKFSPIS